VVKIGVRDPSAVIQGKSADGGRQMDVEIAFKISAESVDGQIDAGQEVMLRGQLFDDVGGERRNRVEEVAIDPEEGLEVGRHGPGDMLPCRVWKGVEGRFNPMVGGLFSAGGTES